MLAAGTVSGTRLGVSLSSSLLSDRPATMLRFVLLFAVLLAGLFVAELLQPVDDYVILPFTGAIAKVCVFIVGSFDPHALAIGKELRSTTNGFAISIERGCNGVEAVIILVSAMLAFPAPWKHKLAGIGIGFVAIQLLNLVRIISLFYLGQWNRTWFDWFHLYLWQALIVLDALVVFLIWLRYLPYDERRDERPASA
jgi:exosortase H (IPTLxxWG-CTERM-specific)